MCAPEPDFHLPHFSFITVRLVFKLKSSSYHFERRISERHSLVVSVFARVQWSVYDKFRSLVVAREVFTSDACLTGCGGICAHQYFHAVFPDFVLSQALDINCLELLTIVVALKLWGHLWRGLRLTVRCENFVAVTALNSGSCRNALVNSCLREIVTWPLVSSLNCTRFTFLVSLIVMPTCFRVGVRVLRTNSSFYVCSVAT